MGNLGQCLISRCGDLKRDLVEFAKGVRFQRALGQALEDHFGDTITGGEAEIANFLDYFVLQHLLGDGRTVVDHFVDARPELSDAEKAMLLGWKDVFEGIFLVQRREREALVVLNLVDELTYRVRSNIGPSGLARILVGSFVITRLVPVGDDWMLSGVTTALPRLRRDEAYRMARELATKAPELSFRNPRKLQEAWELQRKDRREFIAFFGSDMIVVPGNEMTERMRAYAHFKMHEVRDAQGRSAADRVQQAYGTVPPLVVPSLPEEILQEETVGAIYDEVEGLNFFSDFGVVKEAFETPELISEERHREAVLEYLESPGIPPLPLRWLADRDPQRASEVFGRALDRPSFSWERDGEALLREYKASYLDRPAHPSIVPLSTPLAQAGLSGPPTGEPRRSQRRPGRNDPCPCGSGKKYKRCCGR